MSPKALLNQPFRRPEGRSRWRCKSEMLKETMTYDTIIRGGTIATASDTFSCDVGISGGKITALGADLGADLGSAKEVVDASGMLVLPGGIDSHVHIAQPSGPGIVMADD